MGERERERGEIDSPMLHDSTFPDSKPPSPSLEESQAQRGIDMLFDRRQEKSVWEPVSAPDTLGELMDSRHMLPLVLPSDPRLLGAVPAKSPLTQTRPRSDSVAPDPTRSSSRASHGITGTLGWKLRSRKMREVEIRTLQWIDGAPSAARWYRSTEFEDEDEKPPPPYTPNSEDGAADAKLALHLTPFTNSRISRSRGRQSSGVTPIEPSNNNKPSDWPA